MNQKLSKLYIHFRNEKVNCKSSCDYKFEERDELGFKTKYLIERQKCLQFLLFEKCFGNELLSITIQTTEDVESLNSIDPEWIHVLKILSKSFENIDLETARFLIKHSIAITLRKYKVVENYKAYASCESQIEISKKYADWYAIEIDVYLTHIFANKNFLEYLKQKHIHLDTWSYDYPRILIFMRQMTISSIPLAMKRYLYLLNVENELNTKIQNLANEYFESGKQWEKLPTS